MLIAVPNDTPSGSVRLLPAPKPVDPGMGILKIRLDVLPASVVEFAVLL